MKSSEASSNEEMIMELSRRVKKEESLMDWELSADAGSQKIVSEVAAGGSGVAQKPEGAPRLLKTQAKGTARPAQDAWDRTTRSLLARHGTDLSSYLAHFHDGGRCGGEGVGAEDVNYKSILLTWNVPVNTAHLAVGGGLQPPSPAGEGGERYPFIASLYREARRCFAEEGEFRLAKVLVMTAGLFEQCRVMEFTHILRLVLVPASTSNKITKEALPFMYCAQANTSSDEALKYWHDNWDWEKEAAELARREPVLQINFQNRDDVTPHRITLNPLITFERVLSYCDGAWCAGRQEIRAESTRIVLRRGDELLGVTYVPYARQRCLSTALEAGDTLVVEDVVDNSDSINRHLLYATNAILDLSINHWMHNAFADLHERMRAVPDGDCPSLLRAVAGFWSDSAERVKFLSADTHVVSFCLKLNKKQNASNLSGDSCIRFCCEYARSCLEEKENPKLERHNMAKGLMLTTGLMEQGQFSPIAELLELYSKGSIDKEAMSDLHPWLHDAYAQLNDLKRYLAHLDLSARWEKMEGQSLSVHLRFFHVQISSSCSIDINPLVTLETLLGIHAIIYDEFSYKSIRITTDDGRTIPFGSSRKKSLAQLMIKHKSVLTLEDAVLRREAPWRPEADAGTGLLDVANTPLVNGHVKKALARMEPEMRRQLGEGGSILFAISRYFFPGRSKLLSADEMDKLECDTVNAVYTIYAQLYYMAKLLAKEEAVMEIKVVVLIGALIEQCQIIGKDAVEAIMSPDVFLHPTMSLKSKLETSMPICYAGCVLVEDRHALMNNLEKFDAYKHCNELRSKEPRISICFINRIDGIDHKVLKSLNSHMTFQYFVKTYSIRKRSLQSLLITRNGFRLFITTVRKRTLGQLGWKDGDVIFFEDQANNCPLTKATRGQRKRSTNPKKKNKKQGRANQKNKPHKQIVIPQTEEDLRKEHSKMMSPILEQLENEKLRKIRLNLKNLSMKKTKKKERKPIMIKVVPGPVFNPLTEGLDGKAGKVVYPVIVGNSENLYKSSKKSAKGQRFQNLRAIDLHGCTSDEAITKLEKELPAWIDSAMKEESFTIPVDIVCGGGNQILSEAVEQWIRKNRQVANRPKGFV